MVLEKRLKMEPISTHQVIALLRAKLGSRVRIGKVERVIADLEKDGRMTGPTGRERWASPDDLDAIEAELRRMRAGWYQRRNVRGDFDAWLVVEGGTGYRIRLPYERAWSTERGEETESAPSVAGCWEWPTARLTGVLVRTDDVDGMPAYALKAVGELSDDEEALLTEQWMTGAKVRAQ